MHLDTAISHPVDAFYRSPPNKPCLKIPTLDSGSDRSPCPALDAPGTRHTDVFAHSVHTAPSRTSARFKSMHARTSTYTWALAHAHEHRHGPARTGTLLITHSTQHRGVLYSTSRRAPTHTSIAIAFTGHPTVAATSSSTHNSQSRPLTTAHTHRHHAHAHSASAHALER
jgi:hypothetical protein